jgi:hypothetical protein
LRYVKKTGKNAILRDDRLQVLFNDGSNIGSNKRYRYVDFAFEHVDDLSSVCVESRDLWRNFGEKLGNSTGATKAIFRKEFTKENYVIRTSMFLGDLLGHMNDKEYEELGEQFLKLFTKVSEIGVEKGEKVKVAIISNVTIRDIAIEMLSRKRCGKLLSEWKSHNLAEYKINNLLSVACILIESFQNCYVRIKYLDGILGFGLVTASSLKPNPNNSICSSPILYTNYSKTFVHIKPSSKSPVNMNEQTRQRSECIAPVRAGRLSGIDHENNGMGIWDAIITLILRNDRIVIYITTKF